jgi:amino acid permease
MLSMPFILMKCGILLGPMLFILCGWACEKACHILVVMAKASVRESSEEIGKAVLGSYGQRASELAMALSMANGMVVWFVVLGDIFPRLASKYGLVDEVTPTNRIVIMVALAGTVIFPVSLLRNVMGSIAALSKVSMTFYACFAAWIIARGIGTVIEMEWVAYVPWFQPSGIPSCIPIVTAAMTAQTQFFMIYQVCTVQIDHTCRLYSSFFVWWAHAQNMPLNSIAEMRACTQCACVLVGAVYTAVGVFGFAAVAGSTIPAKVVVAPNIMAHFSDGLVTDAFQVGCAVSIIMSYPLQVFPLRASIWSMYGPQRSGDAETGMTSAKRPGMPDSIFWQLTAALVCGTLLVAIVIPRMDAIYMLSGATGNCTVAFFLPAIFYLIWEDRHPRTVQPFTSHGGASSLRRCAKALFAMGVFTSISGLSSGYQRAL